MLSYKEYKLIKPDNSEVEQINNLITNQDGSIFHEMELNKIIGKKFNSDLYYLVDNPENIQHAAVVHVIKNKVGVKQYNIKALLDIPYSGFIGNKKIDFEAFGISKLESISYVGFPYIKKSEETTDSEDLGETALVDLTLEEDEIFNKIIHSKRRNMIRKATKSGITVKAYFSLEGFDLFWPMLKNLHDRLGYNDLDYDFYHSLFEYYASKKQAFVIIASKDEAPVSGVFIMGNKNYMHYYKGASVTGVKNEGQGELLQWEAIKLSKSLGSRKYDLCNLNKEKHPEIYRFKTGISREIYQYQKYANKSIGYKMANSIAKRL